MLTLSNPISSIAPKKDYFTVQDFLDKKEEFFRYKKSQNLSERTIFDYRWSFEKMEEYIETVCSDKEVRFTITLVRDYISYMLEKVSPNTVNIRLKYLKVYLKYLEEEGYVKDRIASRITKVKEVKNEKKPLTNSDIKKVIAQIDLTSYSGFRDYTIMMLMLSVGTRIGETLNIKVKDIHLKEKYIDIMGDTAKNRTQRVVPINDKLVDLFKTLIAISNEQGNEYVFLSSHSRDKVSVSRVQQQFTKYGKKANLDKNTSPHKFRHTAITNMIKNGSNPLDVCRIAGHSSLEITMTYYHNNLKDLQNAIKNDTLSNL